MTRAVRTSTAIDEDSFAQASEEVGSVSWMTSILAKLRKHPDASLFLKPVDWKRMGLDDYPKVVKKPMDLQTVGRQCRDGHYSNIDAFRKDLHLIWENCRIYNGPGEISSMADRMEAYAKELLANADGGGDGGGVEEEEQVKSKRRRRSSPNEESDSGVPPPAPPPQKQGRGRPPGSKMKRESSAAVAAKTVPTKGEDASESSQPSGTNSTLEMPLSGFRVELLNKFTGRIARLNPKNMYWLLSMLKEDWITRSNGNTVEVNLSQIDDEQIQQLTR